MTRSIDDAQRPRVEALRESERLFRAIFDQAAVGMALVAFDGRFLHVNDKLCEIVGYSRAELLSKTFQQITHSDDLPADEAQNRRLLAGEIDEFTLEKRYVRKDGSTIWVELTVSRPRATEGPAPFTVSAIQDISARRRAEAQAAATRAQLSQVFERVTDAFVALDSEWCYAYVNARAGELFGRRPEELIGKHIWTEFPGGVGQPFHLAYERAMREQKPLRIEDYYAPWDRWFENIIYPSPDGLSIYFHDVTERKRAARALQRANRAMRTRSECGQALMHATEENALLYDICRLLVDIGDYRLAWIGMAMDDAPRSVHAVAAAGSGRDYVRSLRVSWGDNEFGRGPTGLAIRTGQPMIVRDVAVDPRLEKWRAAALEHGFRSSIALPLKFGETQCVGALNIHASEVDAFDAQEAAFLGELADDVARALRALRDRKARDVAELRMQRTTQRMSHLLGASNVVVYSLRPIDGKLIARDVSENIERLLGYSVAEALVPGWWFTHLHPDDRAAIAADNERMFAEGQVTRIYRFAHKDGRHLWIQDVQRVLRDAGGQPLEVIGAWTDVSVRMQAEGELRASEARLRATFEQAALGMAHVAIDGRWLHVNDRLCEIVGYARSEMIGMTFQQITHPDDLATDLDYIRRLLAGEIRTYSLDKRYVRKDGALVWVELTVSLVRLPSGEADYFIAVVEDISEARRDREALREMSALAHLGAWEVDLASGVLSCSEETYRLLGATRPAFDGTLQAFLALIHPLDRPAIEAWVKDCLADRRPADLEFRAVRPSGEVRVLNGRGVLERDGRGQPRRMVGTMQDVTERRQIEQAVRDSEARLRLALEAAQQGIYDLNIQTGDAKVSPEYATMLGFDPATFCETNAAWIERLHPDDRQSVGANYRDYVAGRINDYRVEFRQRTAGGEWKWILSIGRIVERDEHGAPLRMLGTHTDITERKLAEEALGESERRYREMFEANPQPMWVYDLKTLRFLAVNVAAIRKYGYSREEFLSMTLKDLRPPEDVPRLLANVAAVHDGRDEAGVWRHLTKDGRPLFVEITSHVLIFDGRRAEVVLANDVTDRLRAEDERRAAMERFEALFHNAPEAMSISEFGSGRFVQVNDAFCSMFGYPAQEVIGRTSFELGLWSSPERRAQVLADLRAGRRVLARAGQGRTRSGEVRDTLYSADRIDFGGTECLLIMMIDVSEQLHAQRQLKALTQRLLTKEEEERKALAQTLHDRFAQNLAAAKLGLEGALMRTARADAAAMASVPQALRRVVSTLDESITEVRGLLTELRPPLLSEFGLRAALRQEVESRRALGSSAEIVLHTSGVATERWPAARPSPATEYGLFMIAREALANAMLHAQARRIDVVLTVDGAHVTIRVRDDGLGFDPGQAQAPGHLGLTGMRERAALAGARLQIDSQVGAGTTVTVVGAVGDEPNGGADA